MTVTPIEKKESETFVKCIGNMKIRPLKALVTRILRMAFIPEKRRGRPKRTSEELIKRDLMVNNILDYLIFN